MGSPPSDGGASPSVPTSRRRRRWRGVLVLVLGVAMVVSGLSLLVVPVLSPGAQTQTLHYPPGRAYYVLTENISGDSITGTIPVRIPWTATGAMDVVAAACSSYCSNQSRLPASSTVVENFVTTGTVHLDVRNRGAIYVAWYQQDDSPPSPTLTFTVWTGLTEAPPFLLGMGAVVAIVGVGLLWNDLTRARRAPGRESPHDGS